MCCMQRHVDAIVVAPALAKVNCLKWIKPSVPCCAMLLNESSRIGNRNRLPINLEPTPTSLYPIMKTNTLLAVSPPFCCRHFHRPVKKRPARARSPHARRNCRGSSPPSHPPGRLFTLDAARTWPGKPAIMPRDAHAQGNAAAKDMNHQRGCDQANVVFFPPPENWWIPQDMSATAHE